MWWGSCNSIGSIWTRWKKVIDSKFSTLIKFQAQYSQKVWICVIYTIYQGTFQSHQLDHSHKKRKIVLKQTRRYCFNSFNPNFLEPRHPNLHKNCKPTEAKLIRYYFLERRYSDSFICQKRLAKSVEHQVAVFQEKIKELAFRKLHLQITNLTRSGSKILSTLFWNTDNLINLQMNKLNHTNYLFEKNILLPTRYMFTLLTNHWKKVHYQLWIILDQVPMQLIIALQVLLKKEMNIHFYKHSYHSYNHQMFVNPLMNLSYV